MVKRINLRFSWFGIIMLYIMLSAHSLSAQDQAVYGNPISISISYFGETATHPGMAVGIEYGIYQNSWYQLAVSAQIGAYFHPRNHVGAFVDAGVINRVTSKFGLYGEIGLGAGYLHTWPAGEVYIRQEDGGIGESRGWGMSRLKITGDFRTGYDFSRVSDFPGGIFVGLSLFGEYPFNGFILPPRGDPNRLTAENGRERMNSKKRSKTSTRILFFIGILILSVQAACSLPHLSDGDFFYIRNDNAVMPVWVKGNVNSGVFIINLHGGPGGSSIIGTIMPAMQDLEKEYAVVYWDQRASGISQGNPSPATYTVDQFVGDTDLLIDTIVERFEPASIFIFGHSWGGALGAAYLVDPIRQGKITGYINIDSGHNLEIGLPKSVLWLKDYASDQIALGNDGEHWQTVYDWCESTPDMTIPENYFTLVNYRQGSNDVIFDSESTAGFGPDLEFILFSPMSFSVFFNEGNIAGQFNILELNLSLEMANITIPSLVLWGRHDGRNTADMGQDAFDSLGTASIDKKLVFFEQSAHQPFLEEPELFVNEVIIFIEDYR